MGKSYYRDRQWIEDCLNEDMTIADMARECNASEQIIQKWMTRFGLREKSYDLFREGSLMWDEERLMRNRDWDLIRNFSRTFEYENLKVKTNNEAVLLFCSDEKWSVTYNIDTQKFLYHNVKGDQLLDILKKYNKIMDKFEEDIMTQVYM